MAKSDKTNKTKKSDAPSDELRDTETPLVETPSEGDSKEVDANDDAVEIVEPAAEEAPEPEVLEAEADGGTDSPWEPEEERAQEEPAAEEYVDISQEPPQVEEDSIEPETAAQETVEPTVSHASTPVEDKARGGFFPLVLGGVVAAAVGFGGALYFGDELGLGGNTDEVIADLQRQLSAQNDALSSLKSNQENIGQTATAAQQSAAELGGLGDAVAALQAQSSTLETMVETFNIRLSDIEKRPLNEGLSAAAIAAYEREVNDLKELVAAQKAEASELKDSADISAKTALARSAVTRIVAALDSGAPYRAAIVDFASATGRGVPAVLEANADSGVVTMTALQDGFPDTARAALAAARGANVDAPSDESLGGKLGDFFKSHLGARSVEPKAGTDTDAILSRAEAALRAGNLADCFAELDGLADAPAQALADWRAQADTRLAATRAAEDLAQSLNSN